MNHVGRLAVTLVGLLSLAACSGASPTAPTSTASRTSAVSPQSSAAPDASSITWQHCGQSLCGKLTVPLDYKDPSGEKLEIALLKVPAKGKKQGSLVVNPGGPGGSGVAYAAAADYIVTSEVRSAYDVVGFDPRGVGRSSPVDCLSDSELDLLLGAEQTPDDAGEVKVMNKTLEGFSQACSAKAGKLLPHVSTEDVARDMEELRKALGEEKLTYLGKSYGTYLGDTYMRLFPDRVGRFVLDGMYPPFLTSQETEEGQALGLEQATRSWARYCAAQGCSLGTTQEEVLASLQEIFLSFDKTPVDLTATFTMTEAWARSGVAVVLYDEGRWPALVTALEAWKTDKNAEPLAQLAFQYVDRSVQGLYTSNLMEALIAVDCLDHPEGRTSEEFSKWGEELKKKAPVWGQYLAEARRVCMTWPVKRPPPDPYEYKGAPVLVVGTTGDPATPMEWATRYTAKTSRTTLLTFQGEGHTAYKRTSSCVDTVVDDYLLKGNLPTTTKTCA